MRYSLLILILMFFTLTANAASMGTSMGMSKTKLPQGTYVKSNKVMVMKGYMIEKVSKNRATIRRMNNGGITGSFDCTCNGNDGGCDVITTPTSVSCAVSSCKSSCYMITTIPGKTPFYLFRK